VSRVLLTGATGFVGRNALRALTDAGHEVHAVARQRGAEAQGVIWHEVDLLAGCEVVAEIDPEILVHLAWYAKHGEFWSSPQNLRWVEASLALLRAFAAAGGRRVVMAGTCAEYEWSREVYAEDAPVAPATLYGAAKHGLHTVAAAFAEQLGLSLAWGRLFFVYGPHESPQRLVPSLARALLAGERAPMTAGTQRRDFMHVADAGAAFALLADSEVQGPINLATGQGVELRELARLIAAYAGGEELLELGALAMREGDPPSLVADAGRLRDEAGFTERMTLAAGVKDAVAWWARMRDVSGSEAGSRRS
jgi:nucleoside-diphosphate-sugar epimerase